jgi:hypothetical protein
MGENCRLLGFGEHCQNRWKERPIPVPTEIPPLANTGISFLGLVTDILLPLVLVKYIHGDIGVILVDHVD